MSPLIPFYFLSLILLISNFNLQCAVGSMIVPGPHYYRQLAERDAVRYQSIAAQKRRNSRRLIVEQVPQLEEQPPESAAEADGPKVGEVERPRLFKSIINGSVRMPMYAAADYNLSMYMVDMELGTPPVKHKLLVDTGSDLTWVRCRYDKQSVTSRDAAAVPGALAPLSDTSSTFKTWSCGSKFCENELGNMFSMFCGVDVNGPCMYNYSYLNDKLVVYGTFGQDVVSLPTTNGDNVNLSGLIVGYTEKLMGDLSEAAITGVLGLGFSFRSFAWVAGKKLGGIFSYCLVDHLSTTNVTNYLIFGPDKSKAPRTEAMRYTELELSESEVFYNVKVKGISVDGTMLSIPPKIWDIQDQGGMIMDTGSSLTILSPPAYRPVMDALIEPLEKNFPRIERPDHPFEFCFNSTRFNKSMVPHLEFHFVDGSRFKPHIKGYLIDDVAKEDVKCIGIIEGGETVSILGSIMQQNYHWEFDLFRQLLGFYPSTCS